MLKSKVFGSQIFFGKTPKLDARIVWGDQSSVSNHQEDPKCRAQ